MGTRMGLVIVAVADVERSAIFYGTAFGWEQVEAAPVYAEFRLPDGMRFGVYERSAFARNTGAIPSAVPAGELAPIELYLYPEDLESAARSLEDAGGRPLADLAPRDWGDEAVYYADPDGNVIVLARPLG